MTACCPDLPGCSATASNEKQALELLRARVEEHLLRQALAAHAIAAAEELGRRVAEMRAAGAPPAAGGRPHPAPSPMRRPPSRWPSIDQCIATLVHEVLGQREIN